MSFLWVRLPIAIRPMVNKAVNEGSGTVLLTVVNELNPAFQVSGP